MSTPFPIEEQSADERLSGPMSDPWHGPAKPGFFTGMGFNEDTAYLGPAYRVLEAMGSGAAKAERGAADLMRQDTAVDPMNKVAAAGMLSPADVDMAEREKLGVNALSDAIAADAKQRVQAMTPDAATTGTAVQIVHGVGEGAYLATVGALGGGLPGAAALTGGVEASGTYHEQVDQGVSPAAAAESAGVTAVTSAAGVLIPGGFGSSLASKLLTGAGAQVGLGLASRYADHAILEANGYPEMAAQQKVWDSTQVLTDALLGFAFGGIAHLHGREGKAIEAAAKEPGMVDAALATNLAVQDRNLAVGVPVDPAATHAHQDALEVSNQQLLEGKPNDVSQTGVNEAKFATRPVDEAHQAEAQAIANEYVPEPVKAYHGSPHQFTEFDTSRIGTGEGAQAYGYGLYLAEHPDVAGKYAADVKNEGAVSHINEQMSAIAASLEDEPKEYGAYVSKRANDLQTQYEGLMDQRSAILKSQGNVYRTTVPREAVDRMLDWDRPLSEQNLPQAVRDKIADIRENDPQFAQELGDSATGADLHMVLEHTMGKVRAAKWLKENDVPGIRYLDGMSRRGEGEAATRNIVVFDPKTAEITHVNGEAVKRAVEPTEANIKAHIADIARDPAHDQRVGGYLDTTTGEVHLDDIHKQAAEAHAVRLPEGNVGEGHREAARPDAGAGERSGGGRGAREGTTAATGTGESAGSRAATERNATPLADTVQAALRERPGLEVTTDEGKPVRAADLLRQVQEDAHREMADFQRAVNAATNCFARRGA